MIFFDTTSTYFEVDLDDGEHDGEEDTGERPLRRLGHSKDHRPDLPQVVIGLAVTREGIPVRVWVWPGNANDQVLVEQVKVDLAGWRLGRAIYVVDSGFCGRDNLRQLRSGGGHYIAGVKLRSGMPETRAGALPPGPLPHRPRQPARQGGAGRRGRRGRPLRRLPQPGRGRARPSAAEQQRLERIET